MNIDEYVNNRLDKQIQWYDKKSQTNKKLHVVLRAVEIICAALIPFLSGIGPKLPYSQLIIGALGVIIATSVGMSSLMNNQELWIKYRTASETLKHEKFLFLTKSGNYCDGPATKLFTERVEGYISSEHNQWVNTFQNKKDKVSGD